MRHDPHPLLLQLTAADRLGFVQELKQELGDRITRNVRKLVRREIYRALASKDFE